MKFNTAIFYDIENLLKGYSFSDQMLSGLSLAELLASIRKTNKLGEIALQRAYANWSDPRLRIIRHEINDLGIDPIQVFGLSSEQKKNAADIQLAIDAIDLAHLRPTLEVFVIVSGDGGFSALAKKLHEYGKLVIGCAYQQAANRNFRATCDEFVWIAEPASNGSAPSKEPLPSKESQVHKEVPHPISAAEGGVDPRNLRLLSQIKRIRAKTLQEIVQKSQEVLNWYLHDPEWRNTLLRSGISLSVVQQAMAQSIEDFQPRQLGFIKFVEYLQYCCKDLEGCVARRPPSNTVLALRRSPLPQAEVLPDLEARPIHTVETYQMILAKDHPVFYIRSLPEMLAITRWLLQHPLQQSSLLIASEAMAADLGGSVTLQVARLTLTTFANSGFFLCEPGNLPLADQQLTLRDKVQSVEQALQMVRNAMANKLASILLSVDEAVVRQILPEVEDEQVAAVEVEKTEATSDEWWLVGEEVILF